jgi:hypothetical protein
MVFSVVAAVALLGLAASPPSAEASAFAIHLTAESDGGGELHGAPPPSTAFEFGGLSMSRRIPPLRLGDLTEDLGGPPLGSIATAPTTVAATIQQIITEAKSVAGPASSISRALGSPMGGVQVGDRIANLNLGNGEYLTVSETVGQSLIINTPSGSQSTDGGGDVNGATVPSEVATVGVLPDVTTAPGNGPNNSPSVVSDALLPDLLGGIISSPDDPDETTGSLPGTGIGPSQELASAPEPGSLILLGSGLAVAAQWLRRRKR